MLCRMALLPLVGLLILGSQSDAWACRGNKCCAQCTDCCCETTCSCPADCCCDAEPATITKTVMVPTYVTEKRKVHVTEYKKEERTRTCTVTKCVPITEEKTETYTVMVPETRTKMVDYTV